MSAIPHTPPSARAATDPMRRTARAAGVLYLITFVSVPTVALYGPVKNSADFVLGVGGDSGVLWGALSEVVVGAAGIGTAVVLFPVLKRQSETAALGVLAARILETSLIFVGVISLLSVVALRNGAVVSSVADRAALVTAGRTQVALYNGTFLLSQSLMPVVVDLLLGYLLYRSRLVPRVLPIVALVGAPLLLASDAAVFFGAYGLVSPLAALAALPVAVFEFALGVWLIAKGFNPASPLLSQPSTE